jgi:hypothetical protein
MGFDSAIKGLILTAIWATRTSDVRGPRYGYPLYMWKLEKEVTCLWYLFSAIRVSFFNSRPILF